MYNLSAGIERDAVTIYSKYISLDATRPIGISEDLRNETISKLQYNVPMRHLCNSCFKDQGMLNLLPITSMHITVTLCKLVED